MGRKRTKDKDLPQRWTRKHGAIYYQVPPGKESSWDGKKWFRLGDNEAEAFRVWSERIDERENILTFNQLCDRYLLQHTPTCRPKTQVHQQRAIKNLRSSYGECDITEFQSEWAFQYYEKRKESGVSAANTDIKTLSHLFTKAIEWGALKNSEHPIRGLQIKQADNVRDRYIEDWEIEQALSVASDFLRLYVAFKLMTGMDKASILSIQISDLTDDGIISGRVKTKGKQRLYKWTPELRLCVSKIRAIPRPINSMWLFCTRQGQPYIKESGYTSAFDSMWKRFMTKALGDTGLQERFTEHDLRAKAASDQESLKLAQHLLGHADSKITKKVYRRKMEIVTPATIKAKI